MIQYFNRKNQRLETEKVYGTKFLDLAYKNKLGYFFTDKLLPKKLLSQVMGFIEDTAWSANKIPEFVKAYEIDMSLYVEKKFTSFNDFFIRQFKEGKRPFKVESKYFCAGAEARYLGFQNIPADQEIKVKGIDVKLSDLLGGGSRGKSLAQDFDGGTVIIARLCPVDYHRYHFPFSGTVTSQFTVHGKLHSVNPVALEVNSEIFLINERQVAILENRDFGKVAMIEVGALGVGKIIQSAYQKNDAFPVKFDKGAEKGYFLFGGSTVIWLLQKDKIKLSEDLRSNSLQGIETWIPLGDSLGER